MAHWVFLADPTSYGWDELIEERRTVWDGIGNRTAQSRLREAAADDEVLLYHTSPDKALVGIAGVVTEPYPDPSKEDRVVVDLEPVTALDRPLPLAEVKGDDLLAHMSYVRMPRVAVHAASREEWDRVLELSGTDPGKAAGDDPTEVGGP